MRRGPKEDAELGEGGDMIHPTSLQDHSGSCEQTGQWGEGRSRGDKLGDHRADTSTRRQWCTWDVAARGETEEGA